MCCDAVSGEWLGWRTERSDEARLARRDWILVGDGAPDDQIRLVATARETLRQVDVDRLEMLTELYVAAGLKRSDSTVYAHLLYDFILGANQIGADVSHQAGQAIRDGIGRFLTPLTYGNVLTWSGRRRMVARFVAQVVGVREVW